MKAVLISIRPEWVELIARCVKTVEVRKTRPNMRTPFKCYIYCTRHTGGTPHAYGKPNKRINSGWYGKVIGEFVCDKIYLSNFAVHYRDEITLDELSELSCVKEDELLKYRDCGPLYGWHISQLKIYDRPKELSEFYTEDAECLIVPFSTRCNADPLPALTREPYRIKRAPKSWRYVEDLT